MQDEESWFLRRLFGRLPGWGDHARGLWLTGLVTAILAIAAPATAQQATRNECLVCHAQLTDARLSTPAVRFSDSDVHRERNFTCVDCHGGDAGRSNVAAAHEAARGFKGKPAGQAQIATCARCHSDAALMRQFAPRQRVDQAAEYVTSVHGKRLASGDTRVATCASCHGAHGIRTVNDAKSPVFPTNVAATCASCHADAAHMSGYTITGGKPLPTNQLAAYQTSVHFQALTKGNDLSAPTCNDCHGNHGAAPPGVGAVVNVCGSCHASFAQKFETSVHRQIFDRACVECHGNHAVVKPTDAMLGSTPKTLCSECHSGADDKGAAAADAMRAAIERLKASIEESGQLVARVRNAGMEMSAQDLDLAAARSRLTLARTELHAFEPSKLTPIIDEGLTITGRVKQAGESASVELAFRRRGLAISLGAILLVAVALVLKIRQVDRRENLTPPPPNLHV